MANNVTHPFQVYFSSYETGQIVGGAKWVVHGEKNVTYTQTEVALFPMHPVQG